MGSNLTDQICRIERYELGGAVPIVAVAVHDGSLVRAELEPLLAISAADRRREEDAFTSVWTQIAPIRVIATRSRFEVDLNRRRHRAVYTSPRDAWGLKVWKSSPPTDVVERSRALYDDFYSQMRKLFDELAAQFGRFFVYDLHSYNHRRSGPDTECAPAADNPQINICTGGMDLQRCGPVVDRFEEVLRDFDFPGGKLDVRRNIRFRATRFSRWVHENYPGVGVSLALEVSKFYMDEWTGQPDEQVMCALTKALGATVGPVVQTMNSLPPAESAFETTLRLVLDQRTADGHFTGELSASALSTATAVSALSFYLKRKALDQPRRAEIQQTVDAAIRWIAKEQNDDGGWGDTDKNYSNISTTMLVEAALTAAGVAQTFTPEIAHARQYIAACGGIEGLRARYGKDKTFAVPILANCAMAGIVPWQVVSALPFEAACVPQRFYNLMQLPVVSYAIPALVAIGQCKFINDPPWDPVRKTVRSLAIGRSLKVLEHMQPASGGYLEAIPLTSFVAMALIESGRCESAVVENSIRFLLEAVRQPQDGCCWPIDTNLATWGTTLAINGIANDRETLAQVVLAEPGRWHQCIQWLLSCQNTSVHPFTGAAPGGWGWTDLSGAVPDADDTPGALIALKHIDDLIRSPQFQAALPQPHRADFGDALRQQILAAADSGVGWLLALQNRDRGWPTFCRGWGKLPFDRSGADLTAHAIRALDAWKSTHLPGVSSERIDRAIDRGFGYLRQKQRSEGDWLPLWFGNQDFPDDINPCYGTAKVLQAYAHCDLIDTPECQNGLRWLLDHQNDDGGFGGGPSIGWKNVSLGTSTVEETALCAEALLTSPDPKHQAAASRAVRWLERAALSGSIEVFHPIGFYFAKLWYHEKLYPLVFSIAALARAKRASVDRVVS